MSAREKFLHSKPRKIRVNMALDPHVHASATAACRALGVSLSAQVEALLGAFLRRQRRAPEADA